MEAVHHESLDARHEPRGLLEVSDRKAVTLKSGDNAVSGLSPGVYLVQSEPSAVSCQPLAVTKVIIAR